MKQRTIAVLVAAALASMAVSAQATTGPSSSQSEYMNAVAPGVSFTSILTTGDAVQKAGAATGITYRMAGIPDGLGAYDNGDGTFTVLMNHELGNTLGTVRDHGATGAFVSEWVINKSDLSVVSGHDLIQSTYGWNATTQSSNTSSSTISFSRFCSADLAAVTAFYNPATGLGTQARLFLNGEEGGAAGLAVANVATGANKGSSYVLGKMNTATDGSGRPAAVGGWENLLANPFAQDKTIVIGNNDGGTGAMSNRLVIYQGTKTATGTEADKAGLTNGTTKFVNIAGATAEITNAATRATGIANGTRFTLDANAGTGFSRPEDGAWNPNNAKEYYFVTTDQIDLTETSGGTQIGATRLWKLTFDDIANPDAGGKIDLLVDGTSFAGGLGNARPNMFDNISVNSDGTVTMQEDSGNNNHNGKIWQYDPATGLVTLVAKSDPTRFGDVSATGVFTAGTHTRDEETSGVIDITGILGRNDGKKYELLVMQDHAGAALLQTGGFMAAGANPAEMVEGGQLMLMSVDAVPEPETYAMMLVGLGLLGFAKRRSKK